MTLRSIAPLLIACATLLPPAAHGETDPFPESLLHDGRQLVRAGIGTARYAGLFPVYDAALYRETVPGRSDGSATDGARCLELRYRTRVTADQIRTAADTVLQRRGSIDPSVGKQVARLHSAYRDVADGDRYRLCHVPGGATELQLNGALQIRLPGEPFAELYFGIWLQQPAISSSLREALLGLPGNGEDS